ncbi:hypothetical protein BVG16_26030 [Paenibacillus selenitireducens]|uniref:Uncharacterized protein n=1 Tax=Paenibacillus selenitireducens TaxID=1324314 RepID=A0A1T2X2U5_9BACL|nr:hypothetical protein [Paenibacillus selenitireducens]OPA73903.1 hypothetical protein BVG16_26030 [Paenibacillus selenitireducens]
MEIYIERHLMDSTPDEELVSVCFEPLIEAYKEAFRMETHVDALITKKQFYQGLSTGQRALFFFNSYYYHVTKSQAEFYWWSAYFYAQPIQWQGIRWSMEYFQDPTMAKLLEEIEHIFDSQQQAINPEYFPLHPYNLGFDETMYAILSPFDKMFHQFAPITRARIGAYIRSHAEEFVQFKN